MNSGQLIGMGQTVAGARLQEREWGRIAHMRAERPRFYYSRVLAILLVGLVLRMWNLGGASLWTDEVLTAVRAQSALNRSLNSLFSAGNQTPFYFLSLRLLPTQSDMLLRLPSVLLGILGIALTIWIALRLYHSYSIALWAGLLVSVNPYHVLLSRTARPYAMIFVLTLTIAACFLLLARGARSRRLWIVFTGASLIAYITHYTMFALPAAQVVILAILLRDDRRFLWNWAKAQALAVIPTLVWLAVLSQQTIAVGPEWVPVPAPRDLALTLWNMTLGYDGVLEWYLVPGLMLVALGMVSGVAAIVYAWWEDRENLYWLLLAGLTLSVTYTISVLFVSFYVDRYFMMMLPAVLFVMLHGFWQWPRLARTAAVTVVVVTAAYVVLFSFHSGSFTRADWRAAADYVEARWQPGDTIVANRENEREAFSRYFELDEREPEAGVTLLATFGGEAAEAASAAEDAAPAAQRVWVIYRNPIEDIHRQGTMPAFDPFKRGLGATGDWLSSRRDQVVQVHTLRGVTVLLLEEAPVRHAAEPVEQPAP